MITTCKETAGDGVHDLQPKSPQELLPLGRKGTYGPIKFIRKKLKMPEEQINECFGEHTEQMVWDFQSRHRLKVNGKIGRQT